MSAARPKSYVSKLKHSIAAQTGLEFVSCMLSSAVSFTTCFPVPMMLLANFGCSRKSSRRLLRKMHARKYLDIFKVNKLMLCVQLNIANFVFYYVLIVFKKQLFVGDAFLMSHTIDSMETKLKEVVRILVTIIVCIRKMHHHLTDIINSTHQELNEHNNSSHEDDNEANLAINKNMHEGNKSADGKNMCDNNNVGDSRNATAANTISTDGKNETDDHIIADGNSNDSSRVDCKKMSDNKNEADSKNATVNNNISNDGKNVTGDNIITDGNSNDDRVVDGNSIVNTMAEDNSLCDGKNMGDSSNNESISTNMTNSLNVPDSIDGMNMTNVIGTAATVDRNSTEPLVAVSHGVSCLKDLLSQHNMLGVQANGDQEESVCVLHFPEPDKVEAMLCSKDDATPANLPSKAVVSKEDDKGACSSSVGTVRGGAKKTDNVGRKKLFPKYMRLGDLLRMTPGFNEVVLEGEEKNSRFTVFETNTNVLQSEATKDFLEFLVKNSGDDDE